MECQIVWIQTVCKDYQQKIAASKERDISTDISEWVSSRKKSVFATLETSQNVQIVCFKINYYSCKKGKNKVGDKNA